MKRLFAFSCLLAIVVLSSCKNNKKVEIKDGEIGITDAVKAAEAMSEGVEDANKRWEARKAKGDTIALPYKELQAFLPDVNGYTKDGEPKGSQMNMPGMGSWSQAEQRYTNGDKSIKIEITDYNASQVAYTTATALYQLGFSSEDDTKRQGSVDLGIKEVAAYETVYKQEQQAQLTLIAADRFYVNIESNGSNDIDQLKSVAKDVASKLSSKF